MSANRCSSVSFSVKCTCSSIVSSCIPQVVRVSIENNATGGLKYKKDCRFTAHSSGGAGCLWMPKKDPSVDTKGADMVTSQGCNTRCLRVPSKSLEAKASSTKFRPSRSSGRRHCSSRWIFNPSGVPQSRLGTLPILPITLR